MTNPTQNNFRLSDGTIIRADINPNQAATVDVAPILTGKIAADIPKEILQMERDLQAKGIKGTPYNANTSIQPPGINLSNTKSTADVGIKTAPILFPNQGSGNTAGGGGSSVTVKTFTTPSGAVVDEKGNLISSPGNQQSNQPLPDQPHPSDTSLADLLKNPNITQDQKNMIKGVYDIVSKYDEAQAKKLVAAFNVATEFSDPFFKAQTAMVINSLNRGLATNTKDLKFDETQLQNTLTDLKANIAASKDYADFEKTKQLEELAGNYEVDLETIRQNLASVGKTSSSVRSRSEQLLQEQNEGMVESVGKKFSFQTRGLERQQASAERDLPLELERLRDKSTQARIEALRTAEQQVGSGALSGYADLFGGIGGELPRKQVTDALSFSSNWLF